MTSSLSARADALWERLETLSAKGVEIEDPRQTFIADDVELDRIRPGARLGAGTRLQGARTWVGEGARIGSEGPATVSDGVFGEGAGIASGFVEGAVLFANATLGGNAHVRPATILEEEASTAHAVGLKHTILLAWVTLGSVINFCDALMAGGRSRRDHSEVGSGFIHFNFTPWGVHGDKAAPSLVGDVPRGVFYRERRIFLGGSGGMIGPRRVGFGSVAAAGQVVRHDVDDNRLVLRTPPRIDRVLDEDQLDGTGRTRRNTDYIAQLVALRSFYRAVRLVRADERSRPVYEAAIENLGEAIDERVKRLRSYLEEREAEIPELELEPTVADQCPLPVEAGAESNGSHLEFIAALSDGDLEAGREWLREVVAAVRAG